jgi:hypothetical protein
MGYLFEIFKRNFLKIKMILVIYFNLIMIITYSSNLIVLFDNEIDFHLCPGVDIISNVVWMWRYGDFKNLGYGCDDIYNNNNLIFLKRKVNIILYDSKKKSSCAFLNALNIYMILKYMDM